MKQIQPNDYVIWQRKKLCRVVERLPPSSGPLFGGGAPPRGAYLDICPAGITKEEWARLNDDVARFRVTDEQTGEEFEVEGYDLLGPVNEMMVLAMLSKKEGQD
jgi:hypothetical protein